MTIRRVVLAAALLALATPAYADPAEDARNHGYDTAAFEVVCPGMLTVTNPKLRAKLDRMYRDVNSRWREDFLSTYESNIDKPRDTICLTAGSSGWLKLDPAARDLLSTRIKKNNTERAR